MNLAEATVLVVDDEPQLRTIFGVWFEREGCRVLLAQNGAQALELIEQHHVHLVISDIRMPVMDGIEMARRIKARSGDAPAILFVTGFGDIDDRDLGGIGVSKRLNKPILRQVLVEAARECLLAKDK